MSNFYVFVDNSHMFFRDFPKRGGGVMKKNFCSLRRRIEQTQTKNKRTAGSNRKLCSISCKELQVEICEKCAISRSFWLNAIRNFYNSK